jgi:hypothetical protein
MYRALSELWRGLSGMPSRLPLLAFSGWLPKNCFGLGMTEQKKIARKKELEFTKQSRERVKERCSKQVPQSSIAKLWEK